MALTAARVTMPGKIINRELKARGWSQKDLADIIDRPVQAINEIIGGSKQITPNTAHELAQVFGTTPELWMNLETNYRLYLVQREQSNDAIRRRSRIYSIAPVKELIKRGWINPPGSIDELEKSVCDFFDISSPENEPKFELAVNRRHSVERGPIEAAQIATLKRANHLAQSQKVKRFDREKFKDAIPELLSFTKRIEDAAKVPSALMDLGVHFVVVPPLPQSFLDGATFNLSNNPVVMLTLRYDRIDYFWFTLMHEIAHTADGHEGVFIDNNLEEEAKTDNERRADKYAQKWLIDEEKYNAFVKANKPHFSRQQIINFADSINRHPGIVVGRLHHDKVVQFSHWRTMLEKVGPHLSKWIDRTHA